MVKHTAGMLKEVSCYLAVTVLVTSGFGILDSSFIDLHAQTKAVAKDSEEAKKLAEAEEKKKSEIAMKALREAMMGKKISKKDLTAKADAKRDETIAEIREILPKVKGGQKGELVFRLAELYWAKSKYIYNVEFNAFDKAADAWNANDRQGKEPLLDGFLIQSQAYKKQALKNYQIVLKKFPEYPRLDEVLYILAYNEYQAGKKKSAIKHYSKLIRKYPKSEYLADSYLALGEHYFAANNLNLATKAYKKAYKYGIEINKPLTYRYAEYKLAWCDYNAEEYESSLKKFKHVIEESEKASKNQVAGDGAQLKREALNDMVLNYAQLDKVKEAYDYLTDKAGKEKGLHLTSRLASVYENDGNFKKQIETLKLLLRIDADAPNSPDYQARIVTAYSKLGERELVRKEVTRLVELYRPGSAWWNTNKANKMAIERAIVLAEQRMRELVTEYHQYADKHKSYDDYELARDLYGQYLKAFPTADSAYLLNFYYAEILWDLGQWQDAAEQYDAVVTRNIDGKYTRDCAYNSILAWEKIVAGEPKPIRSKDGLLKKVKNKRKGRMKKGTVALVNLQKGRDYSEQKIPFAEQKLADACDAYVKVVPEALSKKDKKLKEELIIVKFKSAYTYNKYFHFDKAAERFGELIRRWPSSKYARRAADSTLDSYAARGKWNELEKWSREFNSNKTLMGDKKFAKSVYNFMEGASFKSIQESYDSLNAEKSKSKNVDMSDKFAKAAQRFNGFVKEFPKSKYASIALFNAMDIFDGASKVDLAMASANQMLGTYSKDLAENETLVNAKAEERIRLNLVRYHQTLINYEEAATLALDFVKRYPDNKRSADQLYDSGVWYLSLGKMDQAISSFERYIEEYPKQKDIPEVYLRMISVYEEKGDWKSATEKYDVFMSKYSSKVEMERKSFALFNQADAYVKNNESDKMLSLCASVMKKYKKATLVKDESSQKLGGFCAYQLLEKKWQAYKKVQINTRKGGNSGMKEIKNLLAKKKKMNGELGREYFDILSFKNGYWGTAGLYRTAEVLLEYSESLRNASDPPSLANNLDALDIYRAQLEDIIFPVEDKAIEALEVALKKSFELGIYSEYTLAIENRLKSMKPSAFGEIYQLPFYEASGEIDRSVN